MFGVGAAEIMVILVIALIVVGPAKLPQIAHSLGRAMREYRRVQEEAQHHLRSAINLEVRPAAPQPSAPVTPAEVPPPVDAGPPAPAPPVAAPVDPGPPRRV